MSTSSYPEYVGMRSTPPGTISPASRWTTPYLANRIVGSRALCDALDSAREKAASLGFGLLLWDRYRPHRAVDCFLRWSKQPEDGRTKLRHYPNIDRPEMFEKGYVAAKSDHSRGSTVDLTLYHLATGELAPTTAVPTMNGADEQLWCRETTGGTGAPARSPGRAPCATCPPCIGSRRSSPFGCWWRLGYGRPAEFPVGPGRSPGTGHGRRT